LLWHAAPTQESYFDKAIRLAGGRMPVRRIYSVGDNVLRHQDGDCRFRPVFPGGNALHRRWSAAARLAGIARQTDADGDAMARSRRGGFAASRDWKRRRSGR